MEKISIDQDSWDGGFGPLSQEQLEEYGLTEYGEQPIDDTILGVYVGQDGQCYEVLAIEHEYWLTKMHYKPHDHISETYYCPRCDLEIDPTAEPEIMADAYHMDVETYCERVEHGLCPKCGRDAPYMKD